MGSVITGTGISVPGNIVTNDDLARIMDTSDEWISTRSGVRERHFVDPGVGSSDLGTEAARRALSDAGVGPTSVDAVVTATMTPDYYAPGIAGLVQAKLGLAEIAAYDLRQQCSGFLYGLDLADSLISSSRADTVVVIGTEVHGGFLPWDEASWDVVLGRRDEPISPQQYERNTKYRSWSVLFGDGAGAMVLHRGISPDEGVLSTAMHSDGSHFELIMVPGSGFLNRPYVDAEQVQADFHLPTMQGGALYRQAVRLMPLAVMEVAEKAGLRLSEIDLVVAHQANDRILEGVRKQLGMSEDKVPSNIARYGNTTAGTLPILYHELRLQGRIRPGTVVCFTAFGAGAHYGALLYREPELAD